MIKYIFLIFCFSSCAGTTGHLKFYDFDITKYEVEKALLQVINEDSTYRVPAKWKSHTKGDSFERIYFYFPHGPEELYQIGFTGDNNEWQKSSTSRLGLISIYQGKQFMYEDELSWKEQDRIQKRFEEEILSKIKYSYNKND